MGGIVQGAGGRLFLEFDGGRQATPEEAAFYGWPWVQVNSDGAVMAGIPAPTTPLPQQQPWPGDDIATLVQGLPNIEAGSWMTGVEVSALDRKRAALWNIIRASRDISANADPSTHPTLGALWDAYADSEAAGDAAAATWPD